MNLEQLTTYLSEHFGGHIAGCRIDKGHVVADVPLDRIEELLEALKGDVELEFDMLMDLTVVDWLERKPRFDVVYHLYSVHHNHRIRLVVGVDDGQAVPTATRFWKIADWLEREMWDLYGVKFAGHPNLKRLLLYDEFKGHPLRKDYAYDHRQPRLEETWPSRDRQIKMPEGEKIHRP